MMGIKGKLGKERFGASMPVHASLFQNLPHIFRNSRAAFFRYITDGEQAAELLPSALELTDPPTAVLVLVEHPWTTSGPFNEAIQFLICAYKGRTVQYVPHILVNSDVAMAAGRESYGYPKKIAHIEFVRENEILACWVERPRGFRICSGLIRPEQPLDPSVLQSVPTVCLRVIPATAGPQLAQLIEVGADMRIKELWVGSGSCHFTGISDLDPWHRIPVRQLLSCTYAVTDLELTEGRVLETM
jgi:acetoacetate decarboxylase